MSVKQYSILLISLPILRVSSLSGDRCGGGVRGEEMAAGRAACLTTAVKEAQQSAEARRMQTEHRRRALFPRQSGKDRDQQGEERLPRRIGRPPSLLLWRARWRPN